MTNNFFRSLIELHCRDWIKDGSLLSLAITDFHTKKVMNDINQRLRLVEEKLAVTTGYIAIPISSVEFPNMLIDIAVRYNYISKADPGTEMLRLTEDDDAAAMYLYDGDPTYYKYDHGTTINIYPESEEVVDIWAYYIKRQGALATGDTADELILPERYHEGCAIRVAADIALLDKQNPKAAEAFATLRQLAEATWMDAGATIMMHSRVKTPSDEVTGYDLLRSM